MKLPSNALAIWKLDQLGCDPLFVDDAHDRWIKGPAEQRISWQEREANP